MAILLLLLGLALGVGFVGGLLHAAARGSPAVALSDTGITFRHGLPLKLFAVGTLIGAEVALVAFAVLDPTLARKYAGVLVAAGVLLGLAGLLLCWEVFRFSLSVVRDGLTARSPWAGPRGGKWADVRVIEFSPGNGWFVVRFRDGTAIRLPAVVPGAWRFLEECEKHLSADQMRPARPGYRWVGRRWPYRPEQFTGPPPARRVGGWVRLGLLLVLLFGLLLVGLVAVNGLLLADRETPVVGRVSDRVPNPPAGSPGVVRVLAYNVAKGFAHRGGASFESTQFVTARLDRMAKTIRQADPDFVFLSDALTECGPCPVNQVEHLAAAVGRPYYLFGENYNLGLPLYRVVGGNAVLCRKKPMAERNINLSGQGPFFVTHNNRRALFGSYDINGERVWLAAVHNDSFDPTNNAVQTQQILDTIDDRPCILAGDFNAPPGSESIRRIRASGRFVGAFDGPPTFPEKGIRIDYVFAPAGWEHVKTEVLPGDASDHRAVLAEFRLPPPPLLPPPPGGR